MKSEKFQLMPFEIRIARKIIDGDKDIIPIAQIKGNLGSKVVKRGQT